MIQIRRIIISEPIIKCSNNGFMNFISDLTQFKHEKQLENDSEFEFYKVDLDKLEEEIKSIFKELNVDFKEVDSSLSNLVYNYESSFLRNLESLGSILSKIEFYRNLKDIFEEEKVESIKLKIEKKENNSEDINRLRSAFRNG
jgi:hypothetical protein